MCASHAPEDYTFERRTWKRANRRNSRCLQPGGAAGGLYVFPKRPHVLVGVGVYMVTSRRTVTQYPFDRADVFTLVVVGGSISYIFIPYATVQ